MHCKSFLPSFRSVKVNGSHYACSLSMPASRHTHTMKYSHTIFRGFYFSVSREQRKGLKEMLVIPLSPCWPEGRWKVGVILGIPSFPPPFYPSLSPCSPCSALLDPSSCPLVGVYPKEGHSHPSPDYFLAPFPARCLELSGSLPDLNMAFRQLNMAFLMDGWWPTASLPG